MMKKLYSIGIIALLGGVHIGAATLEEQLSDAVTEQNPLKVNQLLRRFMRDRMGVSEKRAIVSDLGQFADDILEQKESYLSIVGNKKDLVMCSLGTLVGTFALMYFCHSCYDSYANYLQYGLLDVLFHNETRMDYHTSVSVAPLLFGAYCAYKGWTCSTQQEALKRAYTIQNSLDEKLEELV